MSKYSQDIEQALALRGTMTVAELSDLLGVSDQTIRRVVRPLQEAGRLEKVRGAIRSVLNPVTAPFQTGMMQTRAAKVAVAERVLDLIADGESLAMDAGPVSGFVAQALAARRRLTVVTNSAYVAGTLALQPGNRVFMAGTQLRDRDGAAFDRGAFAVIGRMQVETAILSVSQVHPTRGFLVGEACEAAIAAAMSAIAARTLLGVDHSKFIDAPARGMVALADFDPAPVLICDKPLPAAFAALARGVTVIA